LLAAGAVVTPRDAAPGWVEVEDGLIRAVGLGSPPPRPPDVDAPDDVLVPGFVDLHVHGGNGAGYSEGDPAAARRALDHHRAHRTRTSLASLGTYTPEVLLRTVEAVSGLVAEGELDGVHLEGRWLSRARCGAHDPALLRDPDPPSSTGCSARASSGW
jgi:N-acetylglucosamine-6-phosphate deacetylase